MKKTIIIVLGAFATLGTAYLIWSKTSIGKNYLIQKLIAKWKAMSQQLKQPKDFGKLETELDKLSYKELELLARLTWFDAMGKDRNKSLTASQKQRFERLLRRVHLSKMLQKANLKMLENLILPG